MAKFNLHSTISIENSDRCPNCNCKTVLAIALSEWGVEESSLREAGADEGFLYDGINVNAEVTGHVGLPEGWMPTEHRRPEKGEHILGRRGNVPYAYEVHYPGIFGYELILVRVTEPEGEPCSSN